ncbi:MAG: UDP-N-acetylglucosamine--N-acetylmuramyl-(pentapeptide) pyrophosphoryl-undecaprenol N-acetylglucosamine transferase [Paludibacteraceae bacterium]|nr:UDP-N-acetylglucosamine--N-acetylmuramyl-(pentapeptide) pyrophosphoryl-undecaprenol N-acetylglucosamine transferase [Paludibacteraceae bacterium]
MKYLISGGGTGGHIFPAVSIANALKELDPEADILFVGALGRMEMERVPQAGYKIVGLPVRGFNRTKPWKNISVLWDLFRSMRMAKKIISDFQPNVGVGVGGYASGAAMKVAAKMGIPILLQEQNGFAGVTNKLLKDVASKICVAYEGMERFFPKDKIILTGNPIRQNLMNGHREETRRKTLLIIGGSLGAKTINEAVKAGLPALAASDIDVVWQTGKTYYEQCQKAVDKQNAHLFNISARHKNTEKSADTATRRADWITCLAFLSDMPDRYAQADLVISRAGASSISEICLLGKPAILVPSPNVAEDHQTHNAMALVNKDAAVLVKDADATQPVNTQSADASRQVSLNALIDTALTLIHDDKRLATLSHNVHLLAQTDSATRIAKEVIALARR